MTLARITLAALLIAPMAQAQTQVSPQVLDAPDLKATFQTVSGENSLSALRARQTGPSEGTNLLGFAKIIPEPAAEAPVVVINRIQTTRRKSSRKRRAGY